MEITETDKYYVVTFFPNAEEVEIDDKTQEKGYKAIVGVQDEEYVVMKVMYDKSIYPYDEDDRNERFGVDYVKDTVKSLAGNIRECPICNRLNADVATITKVQLQDRVRTPVAPTVPIRAAQIQSTSLSTGNPFQDMMAQLMFDTKLNPTGQVIAAAALEDDVLMSKAMPTTVEGMVDLVANLTDYASGKGTLFRSPGEVTDYVKALREGVKQPIDEKSPDKKEIPVFRRASTIIVS